VPGHLRSTVLTATNLRHARRPAAGIAVRNPGFLI
jgi:hypothetical protein